MCDWDNNDRSHITLDTLLHASLHPPRCQHTSFCVSMSPCLTITSNHASNNSYPPVQTLRHLSLSLSLCLWGWPVSFKRLLGSDKKLKFTIGSDLAVVVSCFLGQRFPFIKSQQTINLVTRYIIGKLQYRRQKKDLPFNLREIVNQHGFIALLWQYETFTISQPQPSRQNEHLHQHTSSALAVTYAQMTK